MPLEPAGPLLVAPLFAPLGEELLALLRSLAPEDWRRPTLAPRWTVHDVAAHLVDTAWRRISIERDGHRPPPPARAIASYGDLVGFLDELNAGWVSVWRRVSPALTIDAMALAERGLAELVAASDPYATAIFSVAWAGEQESAVWFDLARELTERWHHQQQIRLAVGAPPLAEPRFSRPVLEAFLHALPSRYAATPAAEGSTIALAIDGAERYDFALRRDGERWTLLAGAADGATARIALAEETAWRMLTKSLDGATARAASSTGGEEALVAPFFGTLAIMG